VEGFEVELIAPVFQNTFDQAPKVIVKDLVIPVLVGLNFPEDSLGNHKRRVLAPTSN
jgi:hypothetical protein